MYAASLSARSVRWNARGPTHQRVRSGDRGGGRATGTPPTGRGVGGRAQQVGGQRPPPRGLTFLAYLRAISVPASSVLRLPCPSRRWDSHGAVRVAASGLPAHSARLRPHVLDSPTRLRPSHARLTACRVWSVRAAFGLLRPLGDHPCLRRVVVPVGRVCVRARATRRRACLDQLVRATRVGALRTCPGTCIPNGQQS